MIWLCGPAQQIAGVYDEAMMETYKKEQWTKLPPHVFATAEMAFLHMQLHAQSQSLVVSGESGAGKTETNKHLMSYLIWRAGTALAVTEKCTDLAKNILDTNPVLEAFGNAKTIRNNNSSRFGKYVNIKFNSGWKIVGAEIRTFLLEKSRVNSAKGRGERSYHIFYNVLAGSQRGGGAPSESETAISLDEMIRSFHVAR